jgi:hypothetical protein
MQLHIVVDVQLCQFVFTIRGPHRDKVCDLGKVIDNHSYRVITSWGPWESIDEIHTYVLPFSLRYG